MIKLHNNLRTIKINLPVLQLLNWGPILILSIMSFLTWMVFNLSEVWWPPSESVGGMLHITVYSITAICALYWFLTASFTGPGFVPTGWKPANEADTSYLAYCTACKGYKAPRSLHCKKCGGCVKKMDHHCPWINICVGHHNHLYFVIFLMFTLLSCFQAAIVSTTCLYHAINRDWYIHHGTGQHTLLQLTPSFLKVTMFSTGLSIGAVVAASFLLYGQVTGFLENYTEIEGWVLAKAKRRRAAKNLPPFVYPYDLGWQRNLKLLFKNFDGLKWPIRDGCHGRDMIEEQKAQKLDRESRFVVGTVQQDYLGSWLPLATFPEAALSPPITLAPRLPLRVGQKVRVFSNTEEWLFGVKLAGEGLVETGRRGWFPQAAVTADTPTESATLTHTDKAKSE